MPNRENKRRDRLALRASTAYFLHSVDLMARVVGGDILRGVIFTAIVDANTRHIRPSAVEAQTYSEAGDQVPDGLCMRADSGVLVPGEVIAREQMTMALRRNFENLRRLVSDLREGGVEFAQ